MIPEFLDEALGFNIDRVAILLRRELIRILSAYDLTPEQWQILLTLWHSSQPLTQVEIGNMILRDKPSISKMIQKLVKKGWIRKVKGRVDGRQTLIELTPMGDSFKDEIPSKITSQMSTFFSVLDGKEVGQLFQLIKKLRTSLENSNQTNQP